MSDGKKLASWRKARKLSQGDLATLAGCARITIARMEGDKAPLSDKVREVMAGTAAPPPETAKPVARAKARPVADPDAPPPEIAEALKREPLFARTSAEAFAMRDELYRRALMTDKEANRACVPLIPLVPEWRTVQPVGRVSGLPMGEPLRVNAAIPAPVGRCKAYGPRAIMSERGGVYDYETAHVMRAPAA